MVKLLMQSGTILGTTYPGGSKSITNRVLIMRAMAGVEMPIFGASTSEDTLVLNTLLKENPAEWHVGDAGTAARFSAAYLASRSGRETLIRGSERMNQRPMKPLLDALRLLGAEITCLEKEGFLPVRINGKKLQGGRLKLPADISSQFISALAMVAPYGEADLTMEFDRVPLSKPYLDMTLHLLGSFFISFSENYTPEGGYQLTVHRGTPVLPAEYHVEPDWSSASYWYSAAALANTAEVELEGFSEESIQGDALVASLFEALGVSTRYTETGILIRKTGTPESDYFEFDFSDYPDLVPAFAVTLPLLGIKARLSGLETLRYKESDRVAILRQNLNALGIDAQTEENDSVLHILPATRNQLNQDALIESAGDHRMVMGFTPAVLKTGRLTLSSGTEVKKSYPGFWKDVQSLYKGIQLA